MNFLKTLLYSSLLIVAFLFSYFLFLTPNNIIDTKDYQVYLDTDHTQKSVDQIEADRLFWSKKLANNEGNTVYLAQVAHTLSKYFKLTGDVQALHCSDSLLHTVNERIPNQVSILHTLALNAITRHEFQEAEQYIEEAIQIGEKQYISQLLYADVSLERGQLVRAKGALKALQMPKKFDYLIRDVKLQDHQDDLPKAIQQMEQALESATASGNPSLQVWAYSNLGDMYGHAGKIQRSYKMYLKALALQPSDHHSLKGIAWIAFSHDKNTAEARRIIHFLQSVNQSPDYHLLLAEIAAWEGDEMQNQKEVQRFIKKAKRAIYGKMYASYLIELAPEQPDHHAFLERDLIDRPHPSIYALKASTLLAKGAYLQALETFENKVKGRTGEPTALYQGAKIYLANGKKKEAKKYYRAALEASFELGPVITQEIKQQLTLI